MFEQQESMALLGGIIISIATSFNYYTTGRVTGMSGIYSGFIFFEKYSFHWRATFIFAMMATTVFLWNFFGFGSCFDEPTVFVKNLSKPGYFVAGLLVGLGTKLGNGCTSGHGICGLPRLSIRSWVFVPIFLVFGILTATYRDSNPFFVDETPYEGYSMKQYGLILNSVLLTACTIIVVLFTLYSFIFTNRDKMFDIVFASITAVLFAIGLIVSGMNKRSKILGFLTINQNWDPSLMLVLCGAVGLNFITMNLMTKTILGKRLEVVINKTIDFRLILGGILFGIGWGLGGLCPGPGFILFPFFTPHISLSWFGGLTIGQYIIKMYENILKPKKN